MPLLPSEPNRFPENFLEEGNGLESPERRWLVLHTRPRQEKSLARQLLEGQVPFYLPLISRRWRSRRHTLTSHIPLFAGYAFLFASQEERHKALTTRRVLRALEVPDQDGLLNDLLQINRLIATGAPITPEDQLGPGMFVEIKSGPLAGLRGKILRTASGRRFIVQVDFIQRGASVLLDDFVLVKAGQQE